MSKRTCEECGSKIPKHYVVCEVCDEPVEVEEKEEDISSHPGYELIQKDDGEPKEEMDPSTTIWCTVLGKDGSARAYIMFDGAVCTVDGDTLGVINERLQVGSSDGTLLGYVLGDQVYNPQDQELGSLNRGTGTLRDPLGSTLLDVDGIGCCRGQTSVVLGQFEGLGYGELPQIALYVLFLDETFVDESLDQTHQRPPELAEVEQKAAQSDRKDFARTAARLPSGSADRAALERVKKESDAQGLDFRARMALAQPVAEKKAEQEQEQEQQPAPEPEPAPERRRRGATINKSAAPAKVLAPKKAGEKKKSTPTIVKPQKKFCSECGSAAPPSSSDCAVCGEPLA